MEAQVDFLAVVEHRLIPARVRSEWTRLRRKGLASIWAPANQESSHVGNAGVGVISMKGAPLALPTFANAQFWSFFCGRAVRCMLLLGFGRFMHSGVLYGYQGADVNVEPTKIPCLAKGISSGLWVDFEEAWALAAGLQPAPTCKRDRSASGGHRGDFMVGCPLAAAAVLSCRVQPDRWIAPHLAVRTFFDCCRWTSRVSQPLSRTLLWLAFWLSAVDKSRGSKSVAVQRVWEVYDERLQFISRQDAMRLDESLEAGDLSRAWPVWSGAAEAVLADAYRFIGGPIPSRGLVLGRESALFRVVRLGGHKVRKARVHVSDANDDAGVFLYRDSSIAPLLDVGRRSKAAMSVLDAMVRYGISLARSVELTAQWDKILAVGPLYPVTLDDLGAVQGLGIGEIHRVVSDIHHRLSDFIHAVVVHRRDDAIRVWRNRIREDPLIHPYKWLRPDLVLPAPFL